MGFQELVPLVQTGDPVAPSSVNSPLRTLDGNTRALRDLINTLSLGQMLLLRDVGIDPTLSTGQPVYWRSGTAQFEAALGGIETGPDGILKLTPASSVVGILYRKSDAGTLGDVLISGVTKDFDLGDAIDGDIVDGTYFLSSTQAGKLTRVQTPGGVKVLQVAGPYVIVLSEPANMLVDHDHHRFELTAAPAGDHTPPAEGQRHEIENADDNLPGWLPADHASFEDHAPAGAKFGYNLAAQPALANIWPPLPLQNAVLSMRHSDASGLVGGDVPSTLVQLDEHGIWWMSDCYGEVPWPTTYGHSVSVSSSPGACPTNLGMELVLYFTRILFVTDRTAVTSLVSRDERLRITCAGTNEPASTGALEIALALEQSIVSDTESGFLAIKTLDPETGQFRRGPMLEGLYALSTNITLESEATPQLLDSEDNDSPLVYHGLVGLRVSTQPSQELAVKLVRLDGVTEEFYRDIPYLGFAPARLSSFRGVVKVPADLEIVTPQIVFRFVLLGRSAGTLPALTLSYRRIPRPTNGLVTPAALPTDDTALSITTAAAVTADTYVEAQSALISVAAGDTVLFTLSRSASDGYAGQVGILDQGALVS